MRPVRHVESPFDVDPVLHQLIDLGEERLGVEHDAVADGTADAGMQDARRDLVQDERIVADVDGVTGVRPTLVAHHPVGALGDDVDELPLPFVAPLGADDHHGTRLGIEHGVRPVGVRNGAGHKKTPPRTGGGVGESYGPQGGSQHTSRTSLVRARLTGGCGVAAP